MENELLNKFNRLYNGCILYAIQLNGFSHSVFYKDKKGERHIDRCSACSKEQYQKYNKCINGIWRSFNEDKTKVLFLGYPNYAYQCNATEYVYKDIGEW